MINYTAFYNNSAEQYGGALVVQNSEIFIIFSKFLDNQAGKKGGAIFYFVSFEFDVED
jgi:hypothetical protein